MAALGRLRPFLLFHNRPEPGLASAPTDFQGWDGYDRAVARVAYSKPISKTR